MPCPRRSLLLATLACAAVTLVAQERRAPPLPTGQRGTATWPAEVVATLRTFFERAAIDEVMLDLRRPPLPPDMPIEIGDDWLAPFRYVQRAVAFEPYFGSLRGARATALARGGNALDRSLLLAELYRLRGTEVRLVRGNLGWRDAERLARLTGGEALEAGDPLLRLVELTADHWWVEVRHDGDWVALDSAFPGAAPGQAAGSRREAMRPDALPAALQANVRIDVLSGERSLLQLERPAAALAGASIRLAALTVAQMPPATPAPGGDDVPPADVDAVAAALPTYPIDALVLRLQLPDGAHDIGPLPIATLPGVRLRVRAMAPLGLNTEVTVPWGQDPASLLVVRIEPGAVGVDRLAAVSRPVYDALRDLARAEATAQQAYLSRPRDLLADAQDLQSEAIKTLLAADDEGAPPTAAGGPAGRAGLPAWSALHIAVTRSWSDLATGIVDATAMASLAAIDRLTPAAGAARPGIRLLGVHWRPPGSTSAGEVTLWLDDPLMVGGGSGARRGLQVAHGLLSSAMLGQVLNRVADRAPLGAFDITLRAVGTGSRLSWWQGRGPEAPPWPQEAAMGVRDDLRRGRFVAGPATPLAVAGRALVGWWAWDHDSGAVGGRVLGELGTAQASVEFGDAVDLLDLDAALASTASLHEAARWLVLAADADRPELGELLPRACAATALVRDLLLAGAPPGWQEPRFADVCSR